MLHRPHGHRPHRCQALENKEGMKGGETGAGVHPRSHIPLHPKHTPSQSPSQVLEHRLCVLGRKRPPLLDLLTGCGCPPEWCPSPLRIHPSRCPQSRMTGSPEPGRQPAGVNTRSPTLCMGRATMHSARHACTRQLSAHSPTPPGGVRMYNPAHQCCTPGCPSLASQQLAPP